MNLNFKVGARVEYMSSFGDGKERGTLRRRTSLGGWNVSWDHWGLHEAAMFHQDELRVISPLELLAEIAE